VSQAFHLPRAGGTCTQQGFEVKYAAAADAPAARCHKKIAPNVVPYNDRCTRGTVNLATMMKIGLISLGVPAASVKAVARGEYRRLVEVAEAYADTSAIVLTTAAGGEHLAPESAPRWKVVFVN